MNRLFDDQDTRTPVEEFVNTYTDWRLPENRVEAFTRVYKTRMYEGDLDHWLSGLMISDYMNLDNEQKAWYCILFGFAYKNHWPMMVLQEFPDIWNVKPEHLEKWYNDDGGENGAWRRTYFNKDCKWNVSKFPRFIQSAKDWLNGGSLYDKLFELSDVGTTAQNFDNLNTNLCQNLYGIGRMTSWLTCQTIFEFFNRDIDKWDLQLKDAGCWSQYEALCYIFNRMDLYENKTKESVKLMEKNVEYLMDYVDSKIDFRPDIYNIESCLCNFRKAAMQEAHRHDFTFFASNEMREFFGKIYNSWETHNDKKINWEPLVLSITQRGPGASRIGWDKSYLTVMCDTGLNFNTHYHYSDEPDPYELLQIPKPEDCEQPKELLSELGKIDPKIVSHYKEKFDPLKHLRRK